MCGMGERRVCAVCAGRVGAVQCGVYMSGMYVQGGGKKPLRLGLCPPPPVGTQGHNELTGS